MIHHNQQQNRYSIESIIGQPSQPCYHHQCSCTTAEDNQLTNNYINLKQKRHHHHIPPPATTNMNLFNSPARSKRGSPSSDPDDEDFQVVAHQKKKKQIESFKRQQQVHIQNTSINKPSQTTRSSPSNITAKRTSNNIDHPVQQQQLTIAATRYATTRYPFPAYVVRLNTDKVAINQFTEEIVHHFKNNFEADIEILNCRTSKAKCLNDEIDFLLFVKDGTSFAILYNKTNWPSKIAGVDIIFPSWPVIPPQLSLILKHVNIQINMDEFTTELKAMFPDIKNVVRMKNKFGNDIHMIKLELMSTTTRQELIDAKKITVNYIIYEVSEFLAPATVLICSKCSGIGHFRKQCTEQNDTCKTCAQVCTDLKSHQCTDEPQCKHCGGKHLSNSMKCPIIKTFRAELTKKILNINNGQSTSSGPSNNNDNNNYYYNPRDHPPLPAPQMALNMPVITKLDELMNKLSIMNDQLTIIASKYDKVDKFMSEQTQYNERIDQHVNLILMQEQELKKDAVQCKLVFERHDNILMKLLLPMFEDLFTLTASLNQDKRGNILDADLKVRLERYLIQVKKTKEGKACLS